MAHGSFHEAAPTADVDWVKVSLKKDVRYRFTLAVTSPNNHGGASITGIYNSSGGWVAGGASSPRQSGWAHAHFTPKSDGVYFVALSSDMTTDTRVVFPPDWYFRVWSSDDAVSEPSGGDLPGHARYSTDPDHPSDFPGSILHAGVAPNNGGGASGRTPNTSDRDLFAVWLDPGVRYRISAHDTRSPAGTIGSCLQVRLLKFPKHRSWRLSQGLLATSAPDGVGYTNLFHTLRSPQPAGLYLIEVRHLDSYLNAALGVSRCGSLLDSDFANEFTKQPDRSHSYSLVVHPANVGRNAAACYVSGVGARPVAWVAPGKSATITIGGTGFDCGIGMELTQGKSYTVTITPPSGVTPTASLFGPSSQQLIDAAQGTSHTFTATETGVHRLVASATLGSSGGAIAFALTDNGRDASYAGELEPFTMVSNLGKQGDVYHQLELRDYAQSFRTGGSSGGYTLDSVDLGLKAHFLQEDVKAPKVKVVEGTAHGTVVYEMTSARDRLVGRHRRIPVLRPGRHDPQTVHHLLGDRGRRRQRRRRRGIDNHPGP